MIFFVHREMIPQVIIFAKVALEPRSVFQTGLAKTVPCTARPGMIPWVNTSVQ